MTSFDLHRLLKYTVELLKPQAERKNLALNLVLDTSLPHYARGDPDRLRQVLLNLINNAIKFTSIGHVDIRASGISGNGDGFTLHCAVEDTGAGVPKKLQDSLFDEFTMGDQSHARRNQGTGLGLAICKRMISLMHGSIGFNSEPGKGSTFYFSVELEMA